MKIIINSIFKILALPLYILYLISNFVSSDRRSILFFTQIVSLIPGFIGIYYRRAFYEYLLDSLGRNVVIGFGTIFSTSKIEIGDNVYIGNYCSIGSSKIKEGSLLATRVNIISGTKQHIRKENKLVSGEFIQIEIGRNCWLGEGSIIAANIGDDTSVAAGAVVIKNSMGNSTLIGNPAKEIKSINTDES